MLHHRMTLSVVTVDFLVHMHLDPKKISQFFLENLILITLDLLHTVLVFKPNWSLQAINLEILFLGQEFGQLFDCKCWESIPE